MIYNLLILLLFMINISPLIFKLNDDQLNSVAVHGDYAPGPGVIRLESAMPGLFDLPNVLDPLLPNLDTYI